MTPSGLQASKIAGLIAVAALAFSAYNISQLANKTNQLTYDLTACEALKMEISK